MRAPRSGMPRLRSSVGGCYSPRLSYRSTAQGESSELEDTVYGILAVAFAILVLACM